MKIKESPSRIIFRIINCILMIILAVICLIPLWHVLMASFSNPTVLAQNTGIVFWPLSSPGHPATLKGYELVLKNAGLARGYANKDIARQFGITEVGVKKHLRLIFAKLGAANRTEAASIALKKQLLKL